METPGRRKVLQCTTFAVGLPLAGCLGGSGDDEQGGTRSETPGTAVDPAELTGSIRPSGDPRAVPEPLSCDDPSFTRFDLSGRNDGFAWGTLSEDGTPTFALRTSDLSVSYGDDVSIALTNLQAQKATTTHRDYFNVELYTTQGWQEVRGWKQGTPRPYPSIEVGHRPGDGFEWKLTFSGDSLVEEHIHESSLTVCPGLPAGRYRFVYRGLEKAVAVAFDLAE